jgi:hypothetical protein
VGEQKRRAERMTPADRAVQEVTRKLTDEGSVTPPIYDLTNRRLEQVEAQWNATGQLDEGQVSFLIGQAKAHLDGIAGSAHLERLLALRTRQNTQASEAWAKAAEQALAGDPRALHDRLRLHRESAATNARVIQSESFETDFLLPESLILAAAMAARAAPDMLAVLKAVEFVGERDLEDGYVPAACPFCQGAMDAGHQDGCALAAAIAKAGGR